MADRYSPNAEAVAKTVINKVRKGESVSISRIAREQGYAPTYAVQPNRITKTKTYIKTIKPVVKRLEELRDKAIAELSSRDISDVNYAHLIDGIDKLTKNIQLLNGGTTDNVALTVQISEAIARKNNIGTPDTQVLTPKVLELSNDTDVPTS